MTCNLLWGTMALAVTMQVAALTSAQPPRGGSPFDRIDANHDGKLSREEILQFYSDHFDQIDTDHDGFITRQEDEAFFGRRGPGGRAGPGGPGGRGGPMGDPSQQATLWVDPVTSAPPRMTYHLFETAVRGKGTQGSYLIYLPLSYATETTRRYPVIYWLHGGNNTARQGSVAVERIDRAIRAGLMPETIVVSVQGLPIGWYANSVDGKRPVEDVITKDLIPHVDATYRTINRREGRGVEGFSMGGYGALHLGMKYPEIFGVISSVAPSILRNLSDEPIERTVDTFGGSQEVYEANHPWTLAGQQVVELRRNTKIRLLAGDEDFRQRSAITSLHDRLAELKIPHQFAEIQGVGHQYDAIIDGLGDDAFSFWKQAFGRPK